MIKSSPVIKRIVIDGNDGTGKTTLVALLSREASLAAYQIHDRGLPTKMTDSPDVAPAPDELYIILDVPVEVSRQRLEDAKKDLSERYHTVADLTHYRTRFLEIASHLPQCAVIDATGTFSATLAAATQAIHRLLEQTQPKPAVRISPQPPNCS